MLDLFLDAAYEKNKAATEGVKLAKALMHLPESDLLKLATGEAKLAFGDSEEWLEKYKGTPLFEQAMELERQGIENDIARAQADSQRPDMSHFCKIEDNIRLQKKLLDLELVRHAGTPEMAGQIPMSVTPDAQGAGAPGDAGPTAETGVEPAKMAAAEKTAIIGPLMDIGNLGIPSAVGYFIGKGTGKREAEAGAPADEASLAAGALLPGYIGYRMGKARGRELAEHPKTAAATKEALSTGAIEKAVVNTVAKGKMTPERAQHAAELGRKVISKGSKMLQGGFDSGKATRLGTGGSLIRQGATLQTLGSKMAAAYRFEKAALDLKALGTQALNLAKSNPHAVGTAVGAGVGALGGAVAGGKDHRLSGALGGAVAGAGLGHAAGGIGSRMAAGQTLGAAARGYGNELSGMAQKLMPEKVNPEQYRVLPKKPPSPAQSLNHQAANSTLDALEQKFGHALRELAAG